MRCACDGCRPCSKRSFTRSSTGFSLVILRICTAGSRQWHPHWSEYCRANNISSSLMIMAVIGPAGFWLRWPAWWRTWWNYSGILMCGHLIKQYNHTSANPKTTHTGSYKKTILSYSLRPISYNNVTLSCTTGQLCLFLDSSIEEWQI